MASEVVADGSTRRNCRAAASLLAWPLEKQAEPTDSAGLLSLRGRFGLVISENDAYDTNGKLRFPRMTCVDRFGLAFAIRST